MEQTKNIRIFWQESRHLVEIRGDPFITFAPRGLGGLEKWLIVRTIVLIGCVKMRTRGEGVQNPKNFANVINGCPLMQS